MSAPCPPPLQTALPASRLLSTCFQILLVAPHLWGFSCPTCNGNAPCPPATFLSSFPASFYFLVISIIKHLCIFHVLSVVKYPVRVRGSLIPRTSEECSFLRRAFSYPVFPPAHPAPKAGEKGSSIGQSEAFWSRGGEVFGKPLRFLHDSHSWSLMWPLVSNVLTDRTQMTSSKAVVT